MFLFALSPIDLGGSSDGSGGGVTPIPSQPSNVSGGTGDSSFLSGLGSLFSSVAAGVSSGIKASQPAPSPYRPYVTATGVNQSVAPYGIASLFSSPLVLLALAVGAYLLIRKK